ncbi:MAG: hypothetical protein IIV87_04165 [Oscillospiraceae bacterium]|nr:hypothetical protein [Oscillospiraceae bacterium]
MKQGKHYTTLILWIFLAAIVAYLAYSVLSSFRSPLTTATAIEYEAGAGYYATGFVVRDEQIIESEHEITVLTASEGARVATGEPVAIGYLNADAQERQSRITELSAQLEQLQYADRYSSSLADQAELDGEILTGLYSYAKYLNRRDMNSLADLSPELMGLVLRRSSGEEDAQAITRQLQSVKRELEALRQEAEQDTKNIPSPKAGYFSAAADGYESVLTPDSLDSLRAHTFSEIEPEEVSEHAAGKLISGDTWYFVTTIPSAELEGVEAGDRALVTFARDFYEKIDMRVEKVGSNEAGSRLLILSCDRYMQNITLLREQSADIVFHAYTGLRVPKEAVRVNESGTTGVYILEGANAKWKPISILHDNGETYVVELDKSKTGNLWPGDEIIVGAKELYDGKVVIE